MWCTKLEEGSFFRDEVAAMTEKFNCVVIDRDVTPEIAKQFNVRAYPTLLILNKEEKKLLRWSGFSDTTYLLKQFATALDYNALYMEGKPWEQEATRPKQAADNAICSTLPAPSDEHVSGLVIAGADIWVHQKNILFALPLESSGQQREAMLSKALPEDGGHVNDLAMDETYLYALPMGWKSGKGIQRLNMKTMAYDTPIACADENARGYGSSGIACVGEHFYIIQRMGGQLSKVDKATGKTLETLKVSLPGYRLFNTNGLDWDGTHLLTVARGQSIDPDNPKSSTTDKNRSMDYMILKINPNTGKVDSFIPINYWMNAVTYHKGTYYLGEQPSYDYDIDHNWVRVFPKTTVIYSVKPNANK